MTAVPTEPTWVRSVTGRPDGDFYEACDRDELSTDELEAAVHEFLEVNDPDLWPERLTVKVFARQRPVEEAPKYARVLLDKLLEDITRVLLDKLLEDIEETHGDPEGNHDFLSASEEEECLKIMTTAVAAICDKGSAWACEEVGAIEVDVLEYIKQEQPLWLEEEDVKKWREGLGS